MKRVLSIWLPHAGDRTLGEVERLSSLTAVVLTVEGTQGDHPCRDQAPPPSAVRGLAPRLTDARAIDPALVAVPADPAGDAALVERLARWAGRWSPLVEVDGRTGSRLDVTGAAHLFGGEQSWCARSSGGSRAG